MTATRYMVMDGNTIIGEGETRLQAKFSAWHRCRTRGYTPRAPRLCPYVTDEVIPYVEPFIAILGDAPDGEPLQLDPGSAVP